METKKFTPKVFRKLYGEVKIISGGEKEKIDRDQKSPQTFRLELVKRARTKVFVKQKTKIRGEIKIKEDEFIKSQLIATFLQKCVLSKSER